MKKNLMIASIAGAVLVIGGVGVAVNAATLSSVPASTPFPVSSLDPVPDDSPSTPSPAPVETSAPAPAPAPSPSLEPGDDGLPRHSGLDERPGHDDPATDDHGSDDHGSSGRGSDDAADDHGGHGRDD